MFAFKSSILTIVEREKDISLREKESEKEKRFDFTFKSKTEGVENGSVDKSDIDDFLIKYLSKTDNTVIQTNIEYIRKLKSKSEDPLREKESISLREKERELLKLMEKTKIVEYRNIKGIYH